MWGFTVQRFAPKSPPYVVPDGGFVPFAVGYVELPEGVKVEAVLDCTDFAELDGDAEVTLVAAEPVPRFATERPPRGAAMSTGVSIVGAGLSRFGRQPDRTGRELGAPGHRGRAARRRPRVDRRRRSRSAAATGPGWPTRWSPTSA